MRWAQWGRSMWWMVRVIVAHWLIDLVRWVLPDDRERAIFDLSIGPWGASVPQRIPPPYGPRS